MSFDVSSLVVKEDVPIPSAKKGLANGRLWQTA